METEQSSKKRVRGAKELPSNVECFKSEFDADFLEKVAEDDRNFVMLVLSHCGNTIAKKHEKVQLFLDVPDDRTADDFRYRLYVGFLAGTVIKSEHIDYMHRLTLSLKLETWESYYDKESGLQTLLLTIVPLSHMSDEEDMTCTSIHFKRHKTIILGESNANTMRGSIKRTRTQEK
jgi:hypothetical protein